MLVNNIPDIDSDGGDYIILVDNGTEGISVVGQYGDIEGALGGIATDAYGSMVAIVRLCFFDVVVPD